MTTIRWIDSFATGDEVIDDDHRELVVMMQHIEGAVVTRDTGRCRRLFQEFLAAMADHFEREETRLRELNFARVAEHARQHRELLARTDALGKVCVDFIAEDEVKNCLEELTDFMLGELIGADVEIKTFIQGGRTA